ncbi:hypothetical protein MTO96_010623 [Rhipicephalus appendiculatus]
MQMKLAWEQEKYDFVKRIEELEAELRQAHKEFNWKLRALKQRNREYRKAVHSYRSKIKSLKSENQEMHAEAGHVRDCWLLMSPKQSKLVEHFRSERKAGSVRHAAVPTDGSDDHTSEEAR